jgi:hypothetical protein
LEDVFGKGATGKRIPWDLIVGLDDECVKALHVGYLRGDGSVVGTNRGGFDVSSYTVSPSLSAGIYWLSLRLGLFPAFGVVHPEEGHPGFQKVHDGWMTRYGSTDADSLIEAAFAWRSQKNRVPRQRRVWVSEDSVYVGVKEVQHSVYKGEVWDLEIEGDPSFALPMMVVHNSNEQAKNIYYYTKSFWNCFPELSRALLAEDPLQGETRLTNGVLLKIISASEKQARGKHNPGFVVDESCQEGEGVDRMISAAMQGAMSEPNYMVIVLSTFHHPIGLFQEIWDYAEERGFKRFFWNIYDAMETCNEGLITATEEDPEALKFCQTQCPLTEQENTFDEEGKQTGFKYKGCNGKARESKGFWLRKNVLMAKRMNKGTNVFEVEYENHRPNWMRPVYEPEWVEAAMIDPEFPPAHARLLERSAGIDWGLEGQTALVLCNYYEIRNKVTGEDKNRLLNISPVTRFVVVTEAESMTGKLTGEAIRILSAWVEQYGMDKFKVYADVSHPFNNLELEQAGYEVFRVPFNKWKDYGIGNLTKYFTAKGRLYIRSNLTGFIEQLKRYRQDKMGRPVKKDDHGPDALLCAMLNYPFEEKFKEDLEESEFPEQMAQSRLPQFDGCSPVPTQVMVMTPPAELPIIKKIFDGQHNVR